MRISLIYPLVVKIWYDIVLWIFIDLVVINSELPMCESTTDKIKL